MSANTRIVRPVDPQLQAISQMLAEAIMPEDEVNKILADHPTLSWTGDESPASGAEPSYRQTTLEERRAKLLLPESRAAAERTRIILSACQPVRQFKTTAYGFKHSIEAWLRVFGVHDILGTEVIRSDRNDEIWRRSIYVAEGALLLGVASAGFQWRNRQNRTLVNTGQTAQPPPGGLHLPLSKRSFNRMVRELSRPELQSKAHRAPLPQKGG